LRVKLSHAKMPRRKLLAILQEVLAPFAPQLIYLFGSTVKGHPRHDSDIDLALLGKHPYSAYQLFLAAQELADKFGQEVDLVDLSTASAVMKAEIVTTGQLLQAVSDQVVAEFEMVVLSAYAQANEDRREVLRNYGVEL